MPCSVHHVFAVCRQRGLDQGIFDAPLTQLGLDLVGSLETVHPASREGYARASPIPELNTAVIEEVFRRLVLGRLNWAKRLSKEFMQNLLSWKHSGFSARLSL